MEDSANQSAMNFHCETSGNSLEGWENQTLTKKCAEGLAALIILFRERSMTHAA